jgi:HEAT repeat protein
VEGIIAVATDHEHPLCRESAIAALGALGDDRARPAILAALDDKPAVRRRAIVALANFEGPDIEAALERASEDRDWQVRAAVDQLGRGDD